jgi:hypothetical protein
MIRPVLIVFFLAMLFSAWAGQPALVADAGRPVVLTSTPLLADVTRIVKALE